MKKLWLSYAWTDNVDDDVDFIAQQIAGRKIDVRLDRYVLVAGRRLWPQIEKAISDPEQCDAWAVFLTQNSLKSEPVREEISYALDRALKARGSEFPLIGINPGNVDTADVPLSLSTRLYVSLEDEDWLERIDSSVNNRPLHTKKSDILPVHFKTHSLDGQFVIEARPRAGRWYPGFIGVPSNEFENIKSVMQAPAGHATLSGMIHQSEADLDGKNGEKWRGYAVHHNITPINSIYLGLERPVSMVLAGDANGMLFLYRPKY
jgi:hypothetical protein